MNCTHEAWEMDVASHADGLCPLCKAIEVEALRLLLARCRTILGSMAKENESAIFNRWPINHEPLRADARALLPEIDKALEP